MIDTSKAKWGLSKEERYAIKWLDKNGFEGALISQHLSKTKFVVHKNGVTDNFELPQGYKDMNIRAYMEQYRKSFSMLCELVALREKVPFHVEEKEV